jgi:hypothetical protein
MPLTVGEQVRQDLGENRRGQGGDQVVRAVHGDRHAQRPAQHGQPGEHRLDRDRAIGVGGLAVEQVTKAPQFRPDHQRGTLTVHRGFAEAADQAGHGGKVGQRVAHLVISLGVGVGERSGPLRIVHLVGAQLPVSAPGIPAQCRDQHDEPEQAQHAELDRGPAQQQPHELGRRDDTEPEPHPPPAAVAVEQPRHGEPAAEQQPCRGDREVRHRRAEQSSDRAGQQHGERHHDRGERGGDAQSGQPDQPPAAHSDEPDREQPEEQHGRGEAGRAEHHRAVSDGLHHAQRHHADRVERPGRRDRTGSRVVVS